MPLFLSMVSCFRAIDGGAWLFFGKSVPQDGVEPSISERYEEGATYPIVAVSAAVAILPLHSVGWRMKV